MKLGENMLRWLFGRSNQPRRSKQEPLTFADKIAMEMAVEEEKIRQAAIKQKTMMQTEEARQRLRWLGELKGSLPQGVRIVRDDDAGFVLDVGRGIKFRVEVYCNYRDHFSKYVPGISIPADIAVYELGTDRRLVWGGLGGGRTMEQTLDVALRERKYLRDHKIL